MKRNILLFSIIFQLFISNFYIFSQSKLNYNSDSLNKLLKLAKEDTVKIRLNYLIGVSLKINQVNYWDNLLKESITYEMPFYQCQILAQLSRIYKTKNNTSIALSYLNKSIAIAESKHYKSILIVLFKDLIHLLQGRVNQKKILDIAYNGLKLSEELKDKYSTVDFYSEIASHYFFLEDYTKALEMHFNCLKICKELNYSNGIVSALTDIGSDYHAQGNDKKAFEYYLESGNYVAEFKNSIQGAYIFNSIGSGYQLTQQYDSAQKYAQLAYNITTKLNSKQGMAGSSVVLAKALLSKNEIAAAKKKALEALILVNTTGFLAQLPDLALVLKNIYLKENNPTKALEMYELYLKSRDSLVNEKNHQAALQKEFAYSFEKKEQENLVLTQQNQIQLLKITETKQLLIGLLFFLLMVLTIGYLLFKQNRLKSEQQNLRLEQKLLRSQMNPHFIFNSLNSIQQFIISKKNDLAEVYLSKFSSLMRELLESNIKESITIKEEIDILTKYIEMEALRFRNSFTFSIHVDEKLDTTTATIPLMMIQPTVENAIWHGLLPKQGERHLSIVIKSHSNKTVTCNIDDNGIGRQENMKEELLFKKKSLALDFIKQRIELLKKTLKVNCSITIIDKINEFGEAQGTTVIIVLPLLNK